MQAEDETKVVDRESKLAGEDASESVEPRAEPGRPSTPSQSGSSVDLAASARLVGRYEVIHRLGHGGMATVYVGRARGTAGFERLVAVKVIHPHLAREPEFVEMFLDEARIAAKIHDANVVEIIDLGEDDDLFFMVMEYVEGETLSSLLRQSKKNDEPLPLSVALQIVSDTCRGLAAAHDLEDRDGTPLELVHRDVSPHNLLVSMNGRVKVVDFGIMKAAGKRSNTLTGQLRGKVAYMSPEQARSLPVDRRTDVFALGAVLWEMVVGARLFSGETESEVLAQVLQFDGAPLEELPSGVPDDLVAILERALARRADERYATAKDMLDDVRVLMRQLRGDDEPRELLAAAMERHFAARIEYVRATIRGHATGDGVAGGSSVTAANDVSRTIAAAMTPAPIPTGTLSSTLTPQRGRSWATWLMLPAIGAGIGVAVVNGGWTKGAESEPPGIEVAAEEPAPAAAPEKPATPPMVTWWINTDPQGATIFIDGEKQKMTTPLAVKLAKSAQTVLVRVEHEGYKARELRMAPLGPENHSVRLDALAKPVEPGTPTPLHFTADPERPPAPKAKNPRKRIKPATTKLASQPPPEKDPPTSKPTKGDDRELEDMPNFGGVKSTAN